MASEIDWRSVTVRFGDFTALRDVSARLEGGKIHAIVGQNGAGKTTLARVTAGLVAADEGAVTIAGQDMPTGDVIAARQRGVEMVHQSFALPPAMTVAEALEYGSAQRRGWTFSRRSLNRRWQEYLDRSDVAVRADERIRDLSVESKQAVEIARALAGDAKILLLDEPTAVLPPESVEHLFSRLRRLKESGVTILIVLHKVREVLEIADTVTVLRQGELILDAVPSSTMTPAELARAIIGDAPSDSEETKDASVIAGASTDAARSEHERGAELVRMTKLTSQEPSSGPAVREVDLSLYGGQIVGVAGVEGNGQVALVEALAGLAGIRSGTLVINGDDARHLDTLARRRRGLRVIPFERNVEGLSGSSPLWQNWAIPRMTRGAGPFIDVKALQQEARAAFERWDVRFSSVHQKASELSGGNAQKTIFAREIDEEAEVIVAAQPTRGLDISATEFVWRSLRAARDDGAAVLLISSDLDELLSIADRIIVVYGGNLVLDVGAPFDLTMIGDAMMGAVA